MAELTAFQAQPATPHFTDEEVEAGMSRGNASSFLKEGSMASLVLEPLLFPPSPRASWTLSFFLRA